MAQADFIRIQKYLSGIDYPADKDRICEHAQRNGADEEALETLRRIPEGDYDGPDKVSKAVAGS